MPFGTKKQKHMAAKAAAGATLHAQKSAPSCNTRPPIWSPEAQGVFTAKCDTWSAQNSVIAAKRFANYMTVVVKSTWCTTCLELEGAPNGLLTRGLKSKSVVAMRAELRLHGINTEGKTGAALKEDINFLFERGAKVLYTAPIVETFLPSLKLGFIL